MKMVKINQKLNAQEAEVLEEYRKITRNLKKLSQLIENISVGSAPEAMDSLQRLETKTSLVLTQLRASVWSVVSQREDETDNNGNEVSTAILEY